MKIKNLKRNTARYIKRKKWTQNTAMYVCRLTNISCDWCGSPSFAARWSSPQAWNLHVLHTLGSINEPPHDKTIKVTCAPSEDSDQPGHPPSLISLPCPHEKSLGPELHIERIAKTLIRLGECPGWSESSLGAHSLSLVLSWGGSNYATTEYIWASKMCILWHQFHDTGFPKYPQKGWTLRVVQKRYL